MTWLRCRPRRHDAEPAAKAPSKVLTDPPQFGIFPARPPAGRAKSSYPGRLRKVVHMLRARLLAAAATAVLLGAALQLRMDVFGKVSDQDVRHACSMIALLAQRSHKSGPLNGIKPTRPPVVHRRLVESPSDIAWAWTTSW